MNLQHIWCWFAGHHWTEWSEAYLIGDTTAPYPAVDEWERSRSCRRCTETERHYAGFVFDEGASQGASQGPVAFRVKDHADGWILFSDEQAANEEADRTGALMQGLYVRDSTTDALADAIERGDWKPKESGDGR